MICQNCKTEFSEVKHERHSQDRYSAEYWTKNPVCPHCGFNNDQEIFRIFTNGFTSKWGFSDGDLLEDLLFEYYDKLDIPVFQWARRRDVLNKVLKELVAPKLKGDFNLVEISSVHNEIRISYWNGKPVDWYGEPFALDPEYVDVPTKEIIRIIKECEKG